MPYWLRITRRAATLLAWTITGLDTLIPWGPTLSGKAFLFLIALACVGTYAWISYNSARPVDEVYAAGKAMGRREIELERDSGERVVRMTGRRLTVVGGD